MNRRRCGEWLPEKNRVRKSSVGIGSGLVTASEVFVLFLFFLFLFFLFV